MTKYEKEKKVKYIDNWKIFNNYNEVVKYVFDSDPDNFQVFKSDDITENCKLDVTNLKFNRTRSERRMLYEELKAEFEMGENESLDLPYNTDERIIS